VSDYNTLAMFYAVHGRFMTTQLHTPANAVFSDVLLMFCQFSVCIGSSMIDTAVCALQ
jgi:hypothetical protein